MNILPLDFCGVEISDIDITNLNKHDYRRIKEVFCEHLIVVIKNQKVQTVPYVKIIQAIGRIANWNQCLWNIDGERITIPPNFNYNSFEYKGADRDFPVQRVSGMKKNGVRTGIFGTGTLDWHSNVNGPTRARGVGLQGIVGVSNTSTSWMDTTKAYAAMSDELKKRCEGVVGKFMYSPEIWAEGLPAPQLAAMREDTAEYYEMPLVNYSFTGKPGLYFHYLNQCSFPSDPDLLEILKAHCFQPQFIYKHMWEPGDMVISDQVLTLHKRDQDDPDILAERVLSRYTFAYQK